MIIISTLNSFKVEALDRCLLFDICLTKLPRRHAFCHVSWLYDVTPPNWHSWSPVKLYLMTAGTLRCAEHLRKSQWQIQKYCKKLPSRKLAARSYMHIYLLISCRVKAYCDSIGGFMFALEYSFAILPSINLRELWLLQENDVYLLTQNVVVDFQFGRSQLLRWYQLGSIFIIFNNATLMIYQKMIPNFFYPSCHKQSLNIYTRRCNIMLCERAVAVKQALYNILQGQRSSELNMPFPSHICELWGEYN